MIDSSSMSIWEYERIENKSLGDFQLFLRTSHILASMFEASSQFGPELLQALGEFRPWWRAWLADTVMCSSPVSRFWDRSQDVSGTL